MRTHNEVIRATCYKPDRTIRRAEFPISVPETGVYTPIVVTSRQSRRSVVLYHECNRVWAVIDHNSDFAAQVPEPGSMVLLGAGAAAFALAARRRKARKAA